MVAATKEKTEIAPVELKEAPATNLPAVAEAAKQQLAAVDRAPNVYIFPQTGVAKIVTAIATVMNEIGVVEKDGRNEFHRYQYAKMEDILQRLTPLMAKHGVVIFQTELDRCMFDDDHAISVRYAFTIVHSSGEVWPDRPIQTGLSRCRDSKGGFDDKALNKCHTAARKYFLLALFQIPTGNEDDADSGVSGGNGANGVKPLAKKDAQPTFKKLQEEIRLATKPDGVLMTVDEFDAWGAANAERIHVLPRDWQDTIRSLFYERKIELRNGVRKPEQGIVSEKVDAETGEVTETVEWVDEVEADGAAAEAKAVAEHARIKAERLAKEEADNKRAAKPAIPALTEVIKNGGDPDAIPDALRRKQPEKKADTSPTFDAADWAMVCGKAAAACTTIEELSAAQAEHYTPHSDKASKKIRDIALGTFLNRAEELSTPEEEPEPEFDGAQWLRDLDGALSGCEDATALVSIKDGVLLPAKDKVTPEQWNTGIKLYREKMNSFLAAEA